MVEKAVEKSELQMLLEKNCSTMSGLTLKEYTRAVELINNFEDVEEQCWTCKMFDRQRQAIGGTGLCRSCASYALITRK